MHYVMTLVFIILVLVAIDSCNHNKRGCVPQSQCPTITQLQERVAGPAGEQLGDEKKRQQIIIWMGRQK